MATTFEPELGQFIFGQPYKEFEVPEHLISAMADIAEALDTAYGEDPRSSPFANSGESYSNSTFAVEAYSWDEDYEQPWNFKWEDIEVSWYKWFGRGMSVNKIVSKEESDRLRRECLTSLAAEVE